MVIKDLLANIIAKLKKCGNDNPIFEAHLIVRHFLSLTPIDLILNDSNEIPQNKLSLIEDAVRRRISHEPLQYILNSQEFMGLDFYVDENVLIPRQDTEILVEHILKRFVNKGFKALDIGTGSGCIAVSIAHFNKNSFVRGIDISDKAIQIAKHNAEKNDVADRVTFEKADIFADTLFGKYDVIVSNPPYILSDVIKTLAPDVRDYEPVCALDGGEDGLDYYKRICDFAPCLLEHNGLLSFEVGINQAEDVKKLMQKDFKDIQIIKDLCGIDRVVSGILS